MKDIEGKIEKLEKQIGTLKFVILIMAAALIYNSAMKIGLFGDYRITANTLAVKTILLKGKDNQNLGTLSVDNNNSVSISLADNNHQIIIKPENIQFLEIDDFADEIIFKIPTK